MPDTPSPPSSGAELEPDTLLAMKEDIAGDLRQAQKLESLGALVGGVAHDFNNILSIVQASLANLREEGDDPAARTEALDIAQRALQRAAGVVRQLLTFARKTDVKFEIHDLDTIVIELLQMLAEAFPKTLEIYFSSDGSGHPAYCDADQLSQALLNLCINARDAMPDGGRLAIDVRSAGEELRDRLPAASDASYVVVSVTDTGAGMDEATRGRIFEPYFTTKKSHGSGLGLAMTYGIVALHRGLIEVESAVGRGSTFRLILPKSAEAPLADSRSEDLYALAGTESVLFVEDEVSLMRLLRRALERRGYRIFEAREGFQAIDLYREHRDEIAVVVLDMGLPQLSGWEVFQKLKEINPGLRAIVTSGYVDPSLREKMLAHGLKDFVSKPCHIAEMIRTIRNVIDRPAA
jgi:nitrogen-specific signal transduction histidine kinase/ActR/RegA family two-component response regulator